MKIARTLPIVAMILCGCLSAGAADDDSPVDADHAVKRAKGLALFNSDIRNLLKQKCVHCHGGDATEARLDLATQEGLLKGGTRGPAAVIGRGSKSLLVRLISDQQQPRMPKDEQPLSPRQIAALSEWIDLGAPYDEPLLPGRVEATNWTERKVSSDAKQLWSYQPLHHETPPSAADATKWTRSAIDDFILARLNQAQLKPNPIASRAALMRRVYFDVIGLPPSVDELHEFLADTRPDAFERLTDRVLANPHYGERWGRRWLDLVRFAESHGFEHDTDRTSAFHYRDFVVQALNQGMPYDQFVRWQIAGDELAPDDRLAMMATGYLAAGVHSTQITKNEVEKHRYDEMDDMLATIGTSLLGLTIGCARCHDHKFDAIPQADYYRLLSTFTTTVRSEVELDFDPDGYQRAKAEFDRNHAPYDRAVRDFEANELPGRFSAWHASRDAATEDLAWILPADVKFRSQANAVFSRLPDESWLVSGPNPANDSWTITFETDLTAIKSIRIEALADPSLDRSGPGRAKDGNFRLSNCLVTVQPRFQADQSKWTTVKLASAKATFEQNGSAITAAIDDDPNSAWSVDPEFGKDHAAVFTATEPFGFEQGSRVTISLGFGPNGKHAMGRCRVTISRNPDPVPAVGSPRPESVQRILQQPLASLNADQMSQVLAWFKYQDAGWKAVDERRTAHAVGAPKPRVQKVLVATEGLPPVKLHTQAEAEFLKETHFLRRGEPNNKDAVATQSFLQVLMSDPGTPQKFQQPPPTGWRTSYQRTSLTNWLTDYQAGAGNLLARVMVNRLWQHHLGRGLVATPSDFGARGERPTHPELLDWLAAQLIHHQWELKPLHRQILASSVYRQSCDIDESRLAKDRENRLWWHRPRHRLEAEAIRDAILAASDQLDDRLYGPGQLDEAHHRRSIYFTVKRSQLMPSMTVFDAPDGTTPVAERPQTTIAPQALLLMNNQQIRLAARQFATKLMSITDHSPEAAVRMGYLVAVSRLPDEIELANSVAFMNQQTTGDTHAEPAQTLVNFCQVLFCLNEFIYTE